MRGKHAFVASCTPRRGPNPNPGLRPDWNRACPFGVLDGAPTNKGPGQSKKLLHFEEASLQIMLNLIYIGQ